MANDTVTARATIQPFGFERVFVHVDDTAPAPPPEAEPEAPREVTADELREQIADLEARIEQMQADHAAELARARTDGFEAGLAQARAERGEALLAATDALYAGFDAIDARFDTMARAMVCDAGAVALHAAEMLAGHAIEKAPARAVDEALGRVLEQVARGTALVVRAHPDMREDLAALIDAHEARAGRALSINLVDDPAVAPCDARIEWHTGGLNVDADARRAAVMAEMSGLLS